MCGLLPGTAVGAPIGRPLCPVHSAQFFRRPAILLRRAAGGRPYEKPHICRSLSGTAVGAPNGRPSCPVHSAWPSAGGQFCFRRAAGGRPYAQRPNMRGSVSCATAGAPVGARFSLHDLPDFSASRQFCFRRAATGRPYAVKWPCRKVKDENGKKKTHHDAFYQKHHDGSLFLLAVACNLCYGVSAKGPIVSGA